MLADISILRANTHILKAAQDKVLVRVLFLKGKKYCTWAGLLKTYRAETVVYKQFVGAKLFLVTTVC